MNNTKEIKNFWYKTNIIVPLRGFCKVYESGSFSGAAKEMNISQSTVTRQIQAIEREIKSTLFYKTPSGKTEPTKEGNFLYELVKPKIQSFDYIYDYFFLKENSAIEDDIIRLSSHHTIISNILPYCIYKYKQVSKGDITTKFFIKNSSFVEALEDLDNGSIDLAIYPIGEFPDDKKYSEVKYDISDLFTLKPTIILHKDNSLAKKNSLKIDFEDLRKQNMLLVDKDKILSVYGTICEKQNITGNILFENSDWETIKNFLKLNLGIQFYSNIHGISNILEKNLVVKDISHLFPKIEIKLIKKKGKVLSKNLRSFIGIIFDVSKRFYC